MSNSSNTTPFQFAVSTESLTASEATLKLHKALSTVRNTISQHLAHQPDLLAQLDSQLQLAQAKIKVAQRAAAKALTEVLLVSLAGADKEGDQDAVVGGAQQPTAPIPPLQALILARSSSAAMDIDAIPAWRPAQPEHPAQPAHNGATPPGLTELAVAAAAVAGNRSPGNAVDSAAGRPVVGPGNHSNVLFRHRSMPSTTACQQPVTNNDNRCVCWWLRMKTKAF